MRKSWSLDGRGHPFRYLDDVFRGTDAAGEALGWWGGGIGLDGGGLAVRLGGRDDDGASGGWKTGFTLREQESLTLTFRVRIDRDGPRERDDITQVLVAVDGELQGVSTHSYALRVKGGGEVGWRTVSVDIGPLEAGRHNLTIGGVSTGRGESRDETTLIFDKIVLSNQPPLGSFEKRVLKLVNEEREDRGLDPLASNLRLNDAAEAWSRKMAKGDFFEHSDGPSQVEKQGYEWNRWGENIAAGYPTPEAVVEGWMNSPGHRRNILNPDFEEIGIGYHFKRSDGGDAPFGHYWTQEFGTPDDSLL